LKPDSSQKICVIGNSDKSGSEAANKEFGQRRADAVARYLVELGVPEKRIVTSSLGSSKPLVITPPNTPEVANRRAEIVFGC
jgi:peptidoglycan-associated lipoprotein